jgi:hypothetical protein
VILIVDADAADGARDPSIEQRPRPIGIDDKAEDFAVSRADGAREITREDGNSENAYETSSTERRKMEPDQLSHPILLPISTDMPA